MTTPVDNQALLDALSAAQPGDFLTVLPETRDRQKLLPRIFIKNAFGVWHSFQVRGHTVTYDSVEMELVFCRAAWCIS